MKNTKIELNQIEAEDITLVAAGSQPHITGEQLFAKKLSAIAVDHNMPSYQKITNILEYFNSDGQKDNYEINEPNRGNSDQPVKIQAVASEHSKINININICDKKYLKKHTNVPAEKKEALLALLPFIIYLKRIYTNNVNSKLHPVLTEKMPIENCYIHLTMIKQDIYSYQMASQNSMSIQYNAKDIVHLENIYSFKNHQTTLITGVPGIGKTTLCQYSAYQWAEYKLWQNFNVVIWIKLRDLNNNKKLTSLDKIIDFVFLTRSNERANLTKIVKKYLRCLSENVLFIFDGWDELSSSSPAANVIYGLIEEKKYTFLITTRPSSLPEINIDLHLENVGFDRNNIKSFIDNHFQLAIERENVYEFLQKSPLIRSITRIPIMLSIICIAYYEIQELFKNNKEERELSTLSITTLYTIIVGKLLSYYYHKKNNELITIRSILENEFEHELMIIEYLAFKVMLSSRLVFDQYFLRARLEEGFTLFPNIEINDKKLLNNVSNLGIINVIDQRENKQFYEFFHYSICEYFSARYLTRLLKGNNEQRQKFVNFVTHYKYQAKFFKIFVFSAGLIKESPKHLKLFFDQLLKEPRVFTGFYDYDLWAGCLNELNQVTIESSELFLAILKLFKLSIDEGVTDTLTQWQSRTWDIFYQYPKLFHSNKFKSVLQRLHEVCNHPKINLALIHFKTLMNTQHTIFTINNSEQLEYPDLNIEEIVSKMYVLPYNEAKKLINNALNLTMDELNAPSRDIIIHMTFQVFNIGRLDYKYVINLLNKNLFSRSTHVRLFTEVTMRNVKDMLEKYKKESNDDVIFLNHEEMEFGKNYFEDCLQILYKSGYSELEYYNAAQLIGETDISDRVDTLIINSVISFNATALFRSTPFKNVFHKFCMQIDTFSENLWAKVVIRHLISKGYILLFSKKIDHMSVYKQPEYQLLLEYSNNDYNIRKIYKLLTRAKNEIYSFLGNRDITSYHTTIIDPTEIIKEKVNKPALVISFSLMLTFFYYLLKTMGRNTIDDTPLIIVLGACLLFITYSYPVKISNYVRYPCTFFYNKLLNKDGKILTAENGPIHSPAPPIQRHVI